MSKYSKEFKLAVIRHYLSGTGDFKTVAEPYGSALGSHRWKYSVGIGWDCRHSSSA